MDGRSDIFSFGALLYEMVTGRRAFHGDSRLSTLSAILREEPKPASEVLEGLPRELERIIARCLRKSPERRFQAMPDLKVALEELKEESDSGTLRMAPARQQRPGRRLVWAVAVVAILAAGGGTLWFMRSAAKAPEAVLTAVPLTTYPGFQVEPTFSPDGNQVAFSWDGEKRDNQDIYVKLIGTGGPPLRLTTDPAADYSPAWSPDGRFIAFLRDLSREKVAVLLIPALGGPEHKVAEILIGSDYLLPGPFLAWSPDGNWLVVSGRDSPKEPAALFLLSTETGEKRRLTSPPRPLMGDSCPALFSRRAHSGVQSLCRCRGRRPLPDRSFCRTPAPGRSPPADARKPGLRKTGLDPGWSRDCLFGDVRRAVQDRPLRVRRTAAATIFRRTCLADPQFRLAGTALLTVTVFSVAASGASPRQSAIVHGA